MFPSSRFWDSWAQLSFAGKQAFGPGGFAGGPCGCHRGYVSASPTRHPAGLTWERGPEEMEWPRLLPLPPIDSIDLVVSRGTLGAVRGGPGAAQPTHAETWAAQHPALLPPPPMCSLLSSPTSLVTDLEDRQLMRLPLHCTWEDPLCVCQSVRRAPAEPRPLSLGGFGVEDAL